LVSDGGMAVRERPIRVRADSALVERIQRSDRGSTMWITTREPVRPHQSVRLELGLGPLVDEILVDAVVRDLRPPEEVTDAPEVQVEIERRHEERFAYVYDVILGRREPITRRYRRVAARFPIVWSQAGQAHRSFTGDIAAGGTFILGEAPELGSSVEVELWLDSEDPIEVSGLVTWVGIARGEDGFGVQFRKLDAGVFGRLRQLVRRREDAV
jgi:hypothetical protein